MQITALSLRLAAAHKAGSPQAPAAAGAPRRPCPARGGFLMTRAASEGKGPRADRRHRLVADTSDEEEAYLPSDAEADIPMKQTLTSVDLFREMAKMPPEYPPEPEAYDPYAHRTVADMATDDEEELPDDPTALDEELITDTKPFITDVYNQTAGVRRKARNAEASTTSSAGPEDSPKVHPAGGPPAGPGSNMPPDAASRLSVGDKQEPGEAGREERMVAAEEEATDMRHGRGQTQRLAEHEAQAPRVDEPSPKSAAGGPGHSTGRSATDVPGAHEGSPGQRIREEEDIPPTTGMSMEDNARRHAIDQLGGTDRIPPGGSTFLDREAVLRRQEGRP